MAGTSTRENGLKETVTLKWCTPRSNNIGGADAGRGVGGGEAKKKKMRSEKCICSAVSELHYCTGAYRISPTDVNSRPSSCLTNFLLNGKMALFLEAVIPALNVKTISSSRRSIGAAGTAQEVGVKSHQPHAEQPRGRDLSTRAQQQPLHPGGPALNQRGLRGQSDRLPHHGASPAAHPTPLFPSVRINFFLKMDFRILVSS